MTINGGPINGFPMNGSSSELDPSQFPVAINLGFSPARLKVGDTLTALYDYFDPNSIAEDTGARVIAWYRRVGADFVEQPALAGMIAIAPTFAVNQEWRFTIRVSNGTLVSDIATSDTIFVGDTISLDIIIDEGRHVQSFTNIGLTSRGHRRLVRHPIALYMRGIMVRKRFSATSKTKTFGFRDEIEPRGVEIR